MSNMFKLKDLCKTHAIFNMEGKSYLGYFYTNQEYFHGLLIYDILNILS